MDQPEGYSEAQVATRAYRVTTADASRTSVLDSAEERLDPAAQKRRLVRHVGGGAEHLGGGMPGRGGGFAHPGDIMRDLRRSRRGLLDIAGDFGSRGPCCPTPGRGPQAQSNSRMPKE